MPSKKRNTNKPASGVAPLGVSRRDFVKRAAAGAGGIAFAGRISTAFAQAADVIKIGFVSPRTGPLGGFGEGDPFVLGLARKALANGTYVGRQEVQSRDHRPGLRNPIRRAPANWPKSMISTDNVDLMLVTSTPEGRQSGVGRLRIGGRALHLYRHAVGSLVFRPRRQAR